MLPNIEQQEQTKTNYNIPNIELCFGTFDQYLAL
jgi:hypothetical protein